MNKRFPYLMVLVFLSSVAASAGTSALVGWRQALERASTVFAPTDIEYELQLTANTAGERHSASQTVRTIFNNGKSYALTGGDTPTKLFLDDHAYCMQQQGRWGCQQIPAEQFAANLERPAMNLYPGTALKLLKQFVALNVDHVLVANAGSELVANRPCTAFRTVVDNSSFNGPAAANTLYVNAPADANVAGVTIDTCFDQLSGQLLRYTTTVALDDAMHPGLLRSALEAKAFRSEPPADPAFYAVPQ